MAPHALSECLTRSSRLTRLSESQAERPRLRAQVFAPRATADDDDDADVPDRGVDEQPSKLFEERSFADDEEAPVNDDDGRSTHAAFSPENEQTTAEDELRGDAASVGDVPLMRVLDASFAAPEPEAPPVSSTPYSPRGTGDHRERSGPGATVKFSLTLSSAAFDAGPLEAMRGTVCLVDLGPTEKAEAAPHGYRRRLTENVAFRWRGRGRGSSGAVPATAIFELPAASVTLTTRAFVQLTHLAGGRRLDPKVYTHKTRKEAEKFLAKDRKRLEKLDARDGSALRIRGTRARARSWRGRRYR